MNLTVASIKLTQILELAVTHLVPKGQREHRDNRRGRLLKRLQRGRKRKCNDDPPAAANGSQAQQRVVRSGQDDSGKPGEASDKEPSKRQKISWP